MMQTASACGQRRSIWRMKLMPPPMAASHIIQDSESAAST
jgi:hypothetical protein